MTQSETNQPALTWQELICRLDGVYAAKVILLDDETPAEIHILATTEKSPKSLTRDIQSALMAAFGIQVDYRVISIAQIHPDMSEKDSRLCYLGIDIKYLEGKGEVTVYLSCDDIHFEGKASYTARNTTSHLRGIALATLDGIAQFIASNGEKQSFFEILSTEMMEIGGRMANIVTLCDNQGKHYIGSSFIREHNDDAVVRAVLDALNRRITKHVAG